MQCAQADNDRHYHPHLKPFYWKQVWEDTLKAKGSYLVLTGSAVQTKGCGFNSQRMNILATLNCTAHSFGEKHLPNVQIKVLLQCMRFNINYYKLGFILWMKINEQHIRPFSKAVPCIKTRDATLLQYCHTVSVRRERSKSDILCYC